MASRKSAAELAKSWKSDPRWHGVAGPYTPDIPVRISSPEETEQLRMKYEHREAIFGMCIAAIIVLGALGCMAVRIPGAETIVLAVISFLAGYKMKGAHKTVASRRRPGRA